MNLRILGSSQEMLKTFSTFKLISCASEFKPCFVESRHKVSFTTLANLAGEAWISGTDGRTEKKNGEAVELIHYLAIMAYS